MSPIYVPGKVVLRKDYIPLDANYNNVSLLLHGNGTNGSTTITDNSPTPKNLTADGTAQIGTAQSKFGGASLFFPSTASSILESPLQQRSTAQFSANFTVEFWYYPTNAGAAKSGVGQGLFDTRSAVSTTSNGFVIYNSSSNNKIAFFTAGSNRITSSTSPVNNTWYHVAVTRSNSSIRLFINGTQEGVTYANSADFSDGRLLISGVTDNRTGTNMMFEGYIYDLRITKDVARYTANFTPPTEPFPDRTDG